MRKIYTIIAAGLIAWVSPLSAYAASMPVVETERISYDFGIVPQQSATKLARLWLPVLAYVRQETGVELNFKTAKDIPTFEARLSNGQYDFGYMNPYHYTVFHASPGYVAFVKEKEKRIQGIVVVPKESPLKNVSELSGKTMAFPAPAAFAATVLPRAYFLKNKIDVSPKYVSSHDSVYRSVAQGLFPAGGGIIRTFNSMENDVRSQLRILWKTDRYTPHALAAHPGVAKAIIFSIQAALIKMSDDPGGREILSELSIKGFERAVDSDWDDVRALGIELLHNPSQTE